MGDAFRRSSRDGTAHIGPAKERGGSLLEHSAWCLWFSRNRHEMPMGTLGNMMTDTR